MFKYLVITLFVSFSCSKVDSGLKHEQNKPVRENTTHLFADVSDENEEYFFRIAGVIDGIERENFLHENHPLTIRTQFWIDKFDEQIRKEDPVGTTGIPKPVAKLGMKQTLNANVKFHGQCFDNVEIIVNEKKQDSEEEATEIEANYLWEDLCQFKQAVESDVLDILKSDFANGRKLKCAEPAISTSDDGKVTAKVSCSDEKGEKPHYIVKGAQLIKVSPYITIYSGLMTEVSEEVYVGVIAHELGHYYRNHIDALFSSESIYDYYYKITGHEGEGLPKPLASDAPEMEVVKNYEDALEDYINLDDEADSEEKAKIKEVYTSAKKAMEDNHIGHYTTEQEADLLAAEWLHDLGIDYKHFSGFWAEESDSACKYQYKRNWFNNDGELQVVTPGEYEEPHHSACFRAYSVDRDAAAHKYEPIGGSYDGLFGVEGYMDLEAKDSYKNAIDHVNSFFPDRVTVLPRTKDDVVNSADMYKSTAVQLLDVVISDDDSESGSECFNDVPVKTSGNSMTVVYDKECVENVNVFVPEFYAAFEILAPSVVTGSASMFYDGCDFSSFDGMLLSDFSVEASKMTCMKNVESSGAKLSLSSNVDLKGHPLIVGKIDYSQFIKVSQNDGEGGFVKVHKNGDSVFVKNAQVGMEVVTSLKKYFGSQYREKVVTSFSYNLDITDLKSENDHVTGHVDFTDGAFKGSFDIDGEEVKNLKVEAQ